jgi:hypothetical protein
MKRVVTKSRSTESSTAAAERLADYKGDVPPTAINCTSFNNLALGPNTELGATAQQQQQQRGSPSSGSPDNTDPGGGSNILLTTFDMPEAAVVAELQQSPSPVVAKDHLKVVNESRLFMENFPFLNICLRKLNFCVFS